ncbi:MAG: hypothetical protein WCJ64_12885 [Rhodospirillaceae bacterium]
MPDDPYRIAGPALVSFSGGRTSAFMLKHILDAHGGVLPADVRVCFANTGREMLETLNFVEECSRRWSGRSLGSNTIQHLRTRPASSITPLPAGMASRFER